MTKQPNFAHIGEQLAAMDKEEAEKAAALVNHPVVIDELRDLLDILSGDSRSILENSIVKEGIRDPILVWKEKNAVIDGHNRLEIAKKHGLPYQTKEMSFPDISAVRYWMMENQLGRRNLTPDRFTYFLGSLYNREKQNEDGTVGGVRVASPDGKDTAERIAEKAGVSERTVRRAGNVAAGIDKLEQIKGRLAKTEQLSGKGDYTHNELAEIGKQSPKVAPIMVKKLDEAKAKIKQTQQKAKEVTKAAVAAPVKYDVAFAAPDFDSPSFNMGIEPRPALKDNAIVYMKAEDHNLPAAIKLMDKWGLDFAGSVVYYGSNSWDGAYTKTVHEFLLIGTKGIVTGPKKGSEATSVQKINGAAIDHMFKLVDTYHKDGKKKDMRKGEKAKGWE